MIHNKLYLFFLYLIISLSIEASPECEQWVARLISVKGKVEKLTKNQTKWLPVNSYDCFCHGDKIRTAQHARAKLKFILEPTTTVELEPNSTLTFPDRVKQHDLRFNLIQQYLLWLAKVFNHPVTS